MFIKRCGGGARCGTASGADEGMVEVLDMDDCAMSIVRVVV